MFCICASVLAGWSLDNAWLEGAWFGGVRRMSPINALLFMVCGASLALWRSERTKPRWAARLAGIFIALVAAVRFVDASLHLGLPLSQLLFAQATFPRSSVSLGLGQTMPVAFLGIGAGLALLSDVKQSRWGWGQVLIGPAILLAFFAVTDHLYETLIFDREVVLFPMAFSTVICLTLASFGTLMLRPGAGVFGILSAPNLGGTMARWLFPVMLLVPVLLGLLTLWLANASLLYPAAETAALVTLTGPIFAVATLIASRRLETSSVTLMERSRDLELARAAADDANRAKSVFLANMSHELRTPLNAIIGFSEILRGSAFGPLSARYSEYAGDILDSGSHLLEVVNQILDLAKVEARELELIEDRISLKALGESCFIVFRERAAKEEIDLRGEVPDDFPDIIADEVRMKQILLNLMSNAVKFNVQGGKVTLAAGIDGNGWARIWVRDTGIGMNEDDLLAAFTPFRQIDGGFARRREGTGLGLPLARALVERHGGSLDLQGGPGVGMTATIALPPERVWREPPAQYVADRA
jgi:signal transduction histidine kinase